MTALERAETYAAIFLGVGARWPGYVPVDAKVKGDTVYLQGVKMQPTEDGGWLLTENGQSWIVKPRAEANA
jgi:hypothetical protein